MFLSWIYPSFKVGLISGFVRGVGNGLFEDLSMLNPAEWGEMLDGIKQIPKLLGDIWNNPSLLLDMLKGMLSRAINIAECLSPYGISGMTLDEWTTLLTGAIDAFFEPFTRGLEVRTFTFSALEEFLGGFFMDFAGLACTVNQALHNLAFTMGQFAGYLYYQIGITVASGGAAIAAVLGKCALGAKIVAVVTKALDAASAVLSLVKSGISKGIALFVLKHVDEGGRIGKAATDALRRSNIVLGRASLLKLGKGPLAMTDDGLEFLGKFGDDGAKAMKWMNKPTKNLGSKHIGNKFDDMATLEKNGMPAFERAA